MREDEVEELRQLIRVASNCVGPCGGTNAVRSSAAKGARTFITSSAASTLQNWVVKREHHIVRLVIDGVEAHLRQHLDGGWLFLNFCLRVSLTLLACVPYHGAQADPLQLPRTAAFRGVALAACWLEEALLDERCPCGLPFRWSDFSSVLALLRSSLCKPVALPAPEDARQLSVTILEAFLEGLGPHVEDNGDIEAGLRYSWFCGPEATWSSTFKGVVLDTPVAMPSQPPPTGEDLKLVLFEASLEQWLPTAPSDQSGSNGSCTNAVVGVERVAVEISAADAFRIWELAQFRRLADALVEAGVRVLGCQKLVDPWLTDNLRRRGVTVLGRLSLRHMEHVRRLSGAFPVLSLGALPSRWADVCGTVGAVEQRTICARTYTLLHPPSVKPVGKAPASAAQAAPVATLMLGAPDENALAELKQCVPQAVHSLREVARCPSVDDGGKGAVVAGAGLTEVHLADALTARAKLELAADPAGSRVVAAIADCLRDVAVCLAAGRPHGRRVDLEVCGGVGPPASSRDDFLEAARAAIAQLQTDGRLPSGAVLDTAASKRSTLLGALDLAGVLVRLGGSSPLDFRQQSVG